MADITFVSVPPKSLQQTIDGDATTFKLTDINDWNGTALSSASFGTYAWAVFRNTTNTRIEFMRIDPASITSATSPITIVKRGLAFDGSDTEVAANKLTWTQNDTIVELGTHSPQILNYTVRTEGAQTVNGVKTFTSTPVSSAGLPTSSTELATKQYVDNTATGTTSINRVIVAGTAGETIAAGNLIYLKASDGRWWLCDADTAVTVENINMGIAQGAGTAGNAITNGVLTYGLDSNQTGLTANSVYYASNTAGEISLTPGTKEVTVGYALSTTTILFNYRFNQGLTEDQQDALAGTVGTPSASNLFVTNDDTSGTGSIVRASLIANFLSNQTYTYGETITAGDTLYYKNSDSKVYKASASTTDEALYNYIGIALESGVLNDVKKVATIDGSVVTGLSLGNQTTAISETAIVTQSSTAGGNIHNLYDSQPTACGFISGNTQGNITKVTIPFGANNGSGATNVTMNLHEVTNYGSNSVTFGTSLGSVTITPTPSATNTFTFASPVTIKPNVHYVLVFTATGGGYSNYFTLQGSDDSIADTYFFNSGSGVTSPMTVTTVGKAFAISVFSTLTFNYDINDYLFLGDTAGSYSFVGGTNKKVIGRILSSSSIVLGLPAMRTLVKQYTSTPYTNSNASWLLTPVPKNAVALDGMFSVAAAGPTEFIYSFAMDLGKTQSVKQTVTDSTGANAREMGITATWGRGQITPFNEVGYAGHTLPINFYR